MGFSGASVAESPALQASTGDAGFTLVNGTPNILTWTAPNDGQLHTVLVAGAFSHVTSAETGGAISGLCTAPDGSTAGFTVLAAGLAAGPQAAPTISRPVQPGTTVTIQQSSALTAGAAVFWCELWGI